MKSLIYSGAHDAVEVPDAGIVAHRDVPVDVADEVAESLLAQSTWAENVRPPIRVGKGDAK